MTVRRILTTLWLTLLVAIPAAAMQPPPGQSEYVPMKDLPPGDQLPAAPFLIAAYAFVWLATMVYVWLLWRRLNKVEAEMRTLGQKTIKR